MSRISIGLDNHTVHFDWAFRNRHGKAWVVLTRGLHVCPGDAWGERDGRNTLNRDGTDWIVLVRGDGL